MNVNLWNIKDLFSTPTKMGPNKPSSWTSAPSDINSMSDSQFLLGSQFCPENSQSGSVPFEFSIQQRQDKNSLQNSQDNEPSIFAKYQSKPQLFGGDGKDKGSLNFPAERFKSVLEQFEENKKKIKEKHDNEVLNTFILNTKESLQRLQSSLDKFEDTMKFVLDALESLPKIRISQSSSAILPDIDHRVVLENLEVPTENTSLVQETSQSHYGLILNALKERSEMEQTLLGMEKRLQDKDTEISDLKANLQLLKESLEQLSTQQKEQHLSLCEQLGLMQLPSLVGELKAFLSVPRAPNPIKDNISQTSPNLLSTEQPHDSHWSILNVPPGNKVISMVASSQSKEYVDMQQQSSHIAARGHDANNVLCVCCSNPAFPTGSSEGCWLLTQDLSQATPIRKVVKRDNQAKGLNTRRSLQQNQTHIGNALLQNHADDHKNEAPPTDRKMENKSRGRKRRKGRLKIWTHRKRLHSSRKEINCLKCINHNMKQNINGTEYSKSEKSQWFYRNPRNPDDSNLGPSTVVLQSHENTQYVANVQGTSGLKNRMDLPSAKNNSFWLNSSPESCLSPNQGNWFSLFDSNSHTCGTSSQEGTKRYCPLFFDSEYSD